MMLLAGIMEKLLQDLIDKLSAAKISHLNTRQIFSGANKALRRHAGNYLASSSLRRGDGGGRLCQETCTG